MAIEPLYETQLDLRNMLGVLHECGYGLIAIEPGQRDQAGRVFYVDAILTRRVPHRGY